MKMNSVVFSIMFFIKSMDIFFKPQWIVIRRSYKVAPPHTYSKFHFYNFVYHFL